MHWNSNIKLEIVLEIAVIYGGGNLITIYWAAGEDPKI